MSELTRDQVQALLNGESEETGWGRNERKGPCSGIRFADGEWVSVGMRDLARQLLAAMEEVEALKHDIDRHLTICTELATENGRLRSTVDYAWNKAYILHHSEGAVSTNCQKDAAKLFERLDADREALAGQEAGEG